MRKIALLFVAATLITLLHACNMDNNVIKPKCRIVESDLVAKRWVATSEVRLSDAKEIIFTTNGVIEHPHVQFNPDSSNLSSKTYTLHYCNKIEVVDDANSSVEEWTIRELSPVYMRLRFGDNDEVTYSAE